MVMNFCMEFGLAVFLHQTFFKGNLMDKSYANRDFSAIPPVWRPPALAVKDLAIGPLPDNELNVLDTTHQNSLK